MLQTLYFVAMVAAVVWLMAWAALPRPHEGKAWWPFDMREDLPEAASGNDGAAAPAVPTRPPAPISWRERVMHRRAAAPRTPPPRPSPSAGRRR
jgi:hypothetical protein